MPSLLIVILAEPCGSFFSFASFQVRVKVGQRASLVVADFLSIDVYKAHQKGGLGMFYGVFLELARFSSLRLFICYWWL